ncbi:MAG: hypothetical protein AB7H90_23995 [Alphaproteobacteria bacterium]
MSILDYFRNGIWCDKATGLARQLGEVEAERERLGEEATAALLSGDENAGREARDRRLTELAARERDLRRAHATAEGKAAADEAAAEAEQQRQEAGAARQRRAKAAGNYLAQAEEVERRIKALATAAVELIERGQAITAIDGSHRAERFFNSAEIVARIAATGWKHLRVGGSPVRPLTLFPFDVGAFAGAKRELRESESDLLAALHDTDAPATPAPGARPLGADRSKVRGMESGVYRSRQPFARTGEAGIRVSA